MRIALVALTAVLALAACRQVNAQERFLHADRVEDAEALGDAIDAGRCVTIQCDQHRREINRDMQLQSLGPIPTRKPINQYDIAACVRAEDALGEAIGGYQRRATLNTVTSGGVLTFEEAQNLRIMIFNETYYIRRALRAEIGRGNVSQCESLRDRGITMVKQIYQNGMR